METEGRIVVSRERGNEEWFLIPTKNDVLGLG